MLCMCVSVLLCNNNKEEAVMNLKGNIKDMKRIGRGEGRKKWDEYSTHVQNFQNKIIKQFLIYQFLLNKSIILFPLLHFLIIVYSNSLLKSFSSPSVI